MFDVNKMKEMLNGMEELQKKRFLESGKSFIEFFTSREELDQDAAISVVRHLVLFAEIEASK